MGYESTFYAVRKYDFKGYKSDYDASEVISMLEMSKMGYSETVSRFLNLFDQEIPFAIYMEGCDEEGNETMIYEHEDKYGKPIKYLRENNINQAISLVKSMIEQDDYWRFPLLLDFLNMFRDKSGVYICHYGH